MEVSDMADVIFFSGIINCETGEIKFERVSQPFHENAASLKMTVGTPSLEPKDPTLTVFYQTREEIADANRRTTAH